MKRTVTTAFFMASTLSGCTAYQNFWTDGVRSMLHEEKPPNIRLIGPPLDKGEELLNAIALRLRNTSTKKIRVGVKSGGNPFGNLAGSAGEFADRISISLGKIAAQAPNHLEVKSAAEIRREWDEYVVKMQGCYYRSVMEVRQTGDEQRRYLMPLCPPFRLNVDFLITYNVTFFQPTSIEIERQNDESGGQPIIPNMWGAKRSDSSRSSEGRLSFSMRAVEPSEGIELSSTMTDMDVTFFETGRSFNGQVYVMATGVGIAGRASTKSEDIARESLSIATAQLVAKAAGWQLEDFASFGSLLHTSMVAQFEQASPTEKAKALDRLAAMDGLRWNPSRDLTQQYKMLLGDHASRVRAGG